MEQEKTTLTNLQETGGYVIVGINQNKEEVLIADYESVWVDEVELLHHQLITNYQDERSSFQQLMDWLKETLPKTADRFDQLEKVGFTKSEIERINQELEKRNQALLVHYFECGDGTIDLLALSYDPSREQKEELLHYLKYQVEALYMGRLIQLYQLPIKLAYETDLSESLLEVTPIPIDRSLLESDERTILSEFQKLGFTFIHELVSERRIEEAKQKDKEVERGI